MLKLIETVIGPLVDYVSGIEAKVEEKIAAVETKLRSEFDAAVAALEAKVVADPAVQSAVDTIVPKVTALTAPVAPAV